jgi:hypothetical protein
VSQEILLDDDTTLKALTVQGSRGFRQALGSG